jgi:hypothetical protein
MLLTVDTTVRTLHNNSRILHTREQPLVADTSHTTITADVRGSDKFWLIELFPCRELFISSHCGLPRGAVPGLL